MRTIRKGSRNITSFPRLLIRCGICLIVIIGVLLVLPLLGDVLSDTATKIFSWSLTVILIILFSFIVYRNTSRKQKTFLAATSITFVVLTIVIGAIIYGDEPMDLVPWGAFLMFFIILGVAGLILRGSSPKDENESEQSDNEST